MKLAIPSAVLVMLGVSSVPDVDISFAFGTGFVALASGALSNVVAIYLMVYLIDILNMIVKSIE